MNDVLKQFKPSFKNQVARSWHNAKGITYIQAMYAHTFGNWPHCYLCGRMEDFLYDFTPLVWQYRDGKMVQVCLDHPKPNNIEAIVIDGLSWNELLDASTGIIVKLPTPPSQLYKVLRNSFHWLVLRLSYIGRFVWFLTRDLWLWNVCVYVWIWWRDLKNRHNHLKNIQNHLTFCLITAILLL